MKRACFSAAVLFSVFFGFRPCPAFSAENSAAATTPRHEMSKEQYEELSKIFREGTPDNLQKYIESGFNLNSAYGCHTPLAMAIKSVAFALGSPTTKVRPDEAFEKVKIIIEKGADLNKDNCPTIGSLPISSAINILLDINALEKAVYQATVEFVQTATTPESCLSMFAKNCDRVTQEDLDMFKYKIGLAYKEIYKEAVPYVMKILSLLVDNGADVNAKNSEGQPVINAALHFEQITTEPLKYLISKGADVNSRDAEGNPPLFYAVGKKDFTKILIDAGADKKLWNYKGIRYDDIVSSSATQILVHPNGKVQKENIDF